MDEKRRRLLQLVEELDFPIPPDEAREDAEKLTEEDLDKLLEAYEAVRVYREELENSVREADPEKYAEIMEDYHNKMLDAELEYADNSEKGNKDEDQQLEAAEDKAEQNIDTAVNDFEQGIEDVEDVSETLTSKLKNIVGGE
jgi:hypothetical protein